MAALHLTRDAVLEPAPTPATASLDVRTDPSGTPLFSATLVLRAAPEPGQRLADLVDHASLAFELQAQLESGPRLEGVLFEVHGTQAVVDAPGPFGHGALSLSLTGADAGHLLSDLVAGSGGPMVRATLRMAGDGGREGLRVTVDLGALWRLLDGKAGLSRRFARSVLLDHADDVISAGAIRLDPPAADPTARRAAWDRAIGASRTILTPVGGHDTLALSHAPAGDQEIELDLPAPAGTGGTVVVERPLATLLAAVAGHDLERYVHVVTVSGGRVVGLPPMRRLPRNRGGDADSPRYLLASRAGGAVEDVRVAVRPGVGPLVHRIPPLVTDDTPVLTAFPVMVVLDQPEQRPGMVIGGAGIWQDRFDETKHWYLPAFSTVAPSVGVDPDASPFRFDLITQGHAADGSEGLEATVTVTLAPAAPAEAAAAAAAGGLTLSPVPLTSVQVQLAVPFRDLNGADQVEPVPASTIVQTGTLGAPGSTVTAMFTLRDQWARLAYGALSEPGFQLSPVRLQVSVGYEGWSHRWPGRLHLLPDKLVSLARRGPAAPRARAAAAAGPGPRALAAKRIGLTATDLRRLAGSSVEVEPPIGELDAERIDRIVAELYTWTQAIGSTTSDLLVPCAGFGDLYRQRRDGQWVAIGCRPVLRLGETDYRTFEPVDVVAAQGWATVLRSLTQPGRYLLIPRRHCVGRYGPQDGARAYRPSLLLHSTLDADDPTAIRCVLAASLEPDLPPARRLAIEQELRVQSGREVTFLMPWDVGVTAQIAWAIPTSTTLECLGVDRGFTVVLSTDVPGFLVLKTLLERTGLMGSATFAFPGGVSATSTLTLGLDTVTGPYETGPLTVEGQGAERTVTNRLTRRVGCQRLVGRAGASVPVATILDPGAHLVVPVPEPAGDYVADATVETGPETLEEVRAYVEDLELGVVFVATQALGGLAALEIATSLMDVADADPIVLTDSHRQQERQYLLPLTAYVADPILRYTVTAVGADGTRTSAPSQDWPVRTRGVLIPVDPPTTAPR